MNQCHSIDDMSESLLGEVLVLSLVFMAIVCSLHILGKFRSG